MSDHDTGRPAADDDALTTMIPNHKGVISLIIAAGPRACAALPLQVRLRAVLGRCGWRVAKTFAGDVSLSPPARPEGTQ